MIVHGAVLAERLLYPAYLSPARFVRDIRKSSVLKHGRFPDTHCQPCSSSYIAMDTKIKDIVVQVPPERVSEHLETASNALRALARDIGARATRSNASLAYTNLVSRTATDLARLSGFYPSCIEGVAWCARNIFEINLVVRHISHKNENMNRWLGQLAGDEKQIIQGFLTLSEASELPEKKLLQDRLGTIDAITARHNIQASGPFNIKSIANQEQLGDEYVGLYKLFSKYVHPSSWLVNSSADAVQSKEYMNIFIIYSQLHAGDSASRISDWLAANAGPQA